MQYKICTLDMEAGMFNIATGENCDKIDLIGFYDGENYFHFKTPREFLGWLWINMEKYNKALIYAHNGAGYDFNFLYDELSTVGINCIKIMDINGRFIKISLKKKVGNKTFTIQLRDSYRLLPSSLAALGKSFGFPKTEMPAWDGITPYEEHYQKMIEYNKNDCIILHKILTTFFSNLDYQPKRPPLTAPSLAYATWKRMMGIRIAYDLTDACKYDEFIRKAYSGGRCEVFKHSVNEDYAYVDVNSLYPSCMENHQFPVGKAHYLKDEKLATIAFQSGYEGAYLVDWEAPKNLHTPILWERIPVYVTKDGRESENRKLVFRLNAANNYQGSGTYTYPELKLALENGYKIYPREAVVFNETKPIFDDFVAKYKKMKMEGGAKKEIAKLYLNSLYGKCGQRLKVQSARALDPQQVAEIFRKGGKAVCIDSKLGIFNVLTNRYWADVAVIWAAYVTAYARCYMWEMMKRCDFQQAYMDTDSLIIPAEFTKNLPLDETKFGAFKIEGIVHRGHFWAPKAYLLDMTKPNGKRVTVLKIKGIDKETTKALEELGYDAALEKINNNPEFKRYCITQYKMSRRMGLRAGEARLVTKTISLKYDKRIRLEDGINTKPL